MATLNGVTYRKMLVSASKYNIKSPYTMKPKKITIHNTSNQMPAQNEISYMRDNNNQVSYHIAIDEKEVIQGLPFNRNGWHAGDGGNGYGNRNTIGIEMCRSYDRNRNTTNLVNPLKDQFKKTFDNTIKVVAQLCVDQGIVASSKNIKQHNAWSGKHCPIKILNDGDWNKLINGIVAEYNRIKGNPSTVKPDKQQTGAATVTKPKTKWINVTGSWTGQTLKKGQYGAPVTQLQKKLGVKSDSYFGSTTEKAVKAIQRKAGINVDGLAGVATFKALNGANLKVDGYWGVDTTRALQRYFGTPVDGAISKVSPMIKKLQKLLGVKADGIRGPKTYRAMQKRFGTPVDGKVSKPSVMVKELQKRLNKGKL